VRVVIEVRRPTSVTLESSQPWTVNALLFVVMLNVIAEVVILAGWYGASTRGTVSSQVPWAETAIVGAIVAGVADCMWLLRGRRAIGERRRAVLTLETWQARSSSQVVVAAASASADLVRADGMTRVHRSGCPLVAGKKTNVVRRPGNAARCGICGA